MDIVAMSIWGAAILLALGAINDTLRRIEVELKRQRPADTDDDWDPRVSGPGF